MTSHLRLFVGDCSRVGTVHGGGIDVAVERANRPQSHVLDCTCSIHVVDINFILQARV